MPSVHPRKESTSRPDQTASTSTAHLRAKTKVRETIIRDILFAYDAAVAAYEQAELRTLMGRFFQACKDFGLTTVLCQNTLLLPVIYYKLDGFHQFTYLGSTITDNLSIDAEIDTRIGKTSTTVATLTNVCVQTLT